MRKMRPGRFGFALALLLGGALLLSSVFVERNGARAEDAPPSPPLTEAAGDGHGDGDAAAGHADAAVNNDLPLPEKFVARSVCEAQRLKALRAQNPALDIEIPKEFNAQFPTLAACESHDAAWDPSTPGLEQPIPFSHKHHAGDFEMDCMYCHTGADRSPAAGVPSVEVCMGCHAQFPAQYDELEGIQILKRHWEEGRAIAWKQLHRLPEHVKFQHQAHLRAGFDCVTCHGDVAKMDKVFVTEDTRFWPYGLPDQKAGNGLVRFVSPRQRRVAGLSDMSLLTRCCEPRFDHA